MIYIVQTSCVSAQASLLTLDTDEIKVSVANVLKVVEPSYEFIPLNILRRMGKAVRMGVGVAMPLIKNSKVPLSGIVIGTANGGMEDCIKFLNQVIEFEEGTLTPTNFVQSTTNAIASQIGLLSANKGYNITHVQRGLSFENALLDVMMLLKEHPEHPYLLGGVDEVSTYNYNIEYLAGWFKKEETSSQEMYGSTTIGSLAGEGAAMFIASTKREGAIACVDDVNLLHTQDELEVKIQLDLFLKKNLKSGEKIDLLLSGEDGDVRLLKYYEASEAVIPKSTVARFKHLTGEFATASALGLNLACQIIEKQMLPKQMIKRDHGFDALNKILLYNTHKGKQHSFILVSNV